MPKPTPLAARLLTGALALLLGAAAAAADETPETILIRRALGNDLAGHRRSDTELALSAYGPTFAAFHGHGNADPRAWTVLLESRDALARYLAEGMASLRYELDRSVAFIHVRADLAIATSVDSGQVVQRQSDAATHVRVRRLWMLQKVKDDWLVTGVVEDMGDSVRPVTGTEPSAEEIERLLGRERQAWADDDADGVSGLFAEHFVGCDAYATVAPETWKVVFCGAPELAKWARHRMEVTDYQIERQVVHLSVGEQGQVALAVTRESVMTRHAQGESVHSAERYVLWTLGHEGGNWKVTNVCYNVGLKP